MRWGGQEEWLREVHKGGPQPKALRDKPTVPERLQFFWRAFWDLAHDRQVFMGGVSPISFVALDRWAERHGVAGDAFEDFSALIRAMDQVWIDDVAERSRAAAKG